MKIAIVTDAWHPQVNGVVTTLGHTIADLESRGHNVQVFHPGMFRNFRVPGVEFTFALPWGLRRQLRQFAPHCLHIATEGPMGIVARAWASRKGRSYTTSFHTRFPEYLRHRMGIPEWVGYAYLRWFHRRSTNIMANTGTMMRELTEHGFKNLTLWGRGVNTELFHPVEGAKMDISFEGPHKPWPRPYWLNVGRVSVEKNLEAFYQLDLPGTMIQVGDGPARAALEAKYPHVKFVGSKRGQDLAMSYRLADCFVFPSLTDTYGVVILEALASGLPVAAMPSAGPSDIIETGVTGVVDVDLQQAAEQAILLDPAKCREAALAKSWSAATDEFERHLVNR